MITAAAEAATDSVPATTAAPPAHIRVALVGNPNTGKTTLFNELCGMRARTSNYPGTTTAIRVGIGVLVGGTGVLLPALLAGAPPQAASMKAAIIRRVKKRILERTETP